MSDRDRRLIRYGVAGVAVLVGALCAASLTNAVGNTVATVLIGGGLLAIVIFLLRDMGLIETSAKAGPQSHSRNGSDPHPRSSPDAEPDPSQLTRKARRSASVRRPDRMRGQRRRLR
jgi:hypothetical protein